MAKSSCSSSEKHAFSFLTPSLKLTYVGPVRATISSMKGQQSPLTPEEQSALTLVPIVSGSNSCRPKLDNSGKQVQLHGSCWQRNHQSTRDRDYPENMVSVSVVLSVFRYYKYVRLSQFTLPVMISFASKMRLGK